MPGTYSLTSYSPEERVSRNFILSENPEMLVNITDASNLERHLYLTFQLLEMQCPLVMYINKMDSAKYAGLLIDVQKLSHMLGIPIIAGSAKKKENIGELKQTIFAMSEGQKKQDSFQLRYGEDMEQSLTQIVDALKTSSKTSGYKIPLRWLAIKLCEKDIVAAEEQCSNFNNFDSVLQLIQSLESKHKEKHKHSFEIEIALARSVAAKKIVHECVKQIVPEKKAVKALTLKRRLTGFAGIAVLFLVTYKILDALFLMALDALLNEYIRIPLAIIISAIFCAGALIIYMKGSAEAINATDRVDRVLCHRFYGIIILIELVLVFYWITVVLGYKMTDKVFPMFKFFRAVISQLVPAEGIVLEGPLRGLLLNGLIDGAIMILNYIPIFFCLFALVSFLEDLGYMARLAFIMDRILRKFGLHGQSTLPMILSGVIMGGCAVPGVMSTRTIRDDKSRLVTILILPLLNCMAKIPFYVLITGIFFAHYQWLVLGGISFFTLIVALFVARYFSLYVVLGKPEPFVLELPAYNVPTARGIIIRTFERLWNFIKKVATTVAAVSIIIWVGISFPALDGVKTSQYEMKKNERIQSFANELNNSYSSYFTSEKDVLQYDRISEKLFIINSLHWFGGEKRTIENNNRIFLTNPELLKIALRGKLDLGQNIKAFTEYYNRYFVAHKEFLKSCQTIEDFRKPILKSEFYSYWQKVNPFFFAIVRTGSIKIHGTAVVDSEAASTAKALRSLNSDLKTIKSEYKRETLANSLLGYVGKFLEPVTKYAGFNWKINIALLGSFAAKEALVSTLGTIYSVESSNDDSGKLLEARIQDKETGMTPLDGLTIMILISLFPPCIATMMATKTETQSVGWTAFSILYPVLLGSLVAVFIFQFGRLLGF